MCNLALVYSRLLLEGREGEFYPWYALNCLLLGQDCHRTAYTYGVRDSEPEVYRIIDGISTPEAERLLSSLIERLRKDPRLSDYVKALVVNHLYLNHKYDHVLLSGDILNSVSRRYGWDAQVHRRAPSNHMDGYKGGLQGCPSWVSKRLGWKEE
jgi:hypothetical protein